MQTKYRIFVKTAAPTKDAKGQDVAAGQVVHSEDVDVQRVYDTMRSLETQFPATTHSIRSKKLDPLSI